MSLNKTCAVLLVVALSLVAVHAQRVANCDFQTHSQFGYGCVVSGLTVNVADSVQITGQHLIGFNDASVTYVEISGSFLHHIPPEFLSIFPNLQRIQAENNGIATLEAMQNCGNLQTLLLSGNAIVLIRNDIFAACGNMITLNLQNNRLTNIERWAFRGLSRLESLQLNGNELATINADLFTETPELKGIIYTLRRRFHKIIYVSNYLIKLN